MQNTYLRRSTIRNLWTRPVAPGLCPILVYVCVFARLRVCVWYVCVKQMKNNLS